MKLTEFIRRVLRRPTAYEVATREHEEAKVDLLEALTGLDYARALVDYQQNRVRRLDLYLDGEPE